MRKGTSKKGMNKGTRKSCGDNEATTRGLFKWYEKKMEILGYMVLAKKHGNYEKVEEYKRGLYCLYNKMCEKMQVLDNSDKRRDLSIMKMHVETIIEFVKKHL